MSRKRATTFGLLGGTLALFYVGGVISESANVSNLAQLVAGLTAALTCLWSAHTHIGAERHWRFLTGAGMVGWTLGQLIYSWYRLGHGQQMPSPSWADAGYLSLPLFALLALALLVSERTASITEPEIIFRRTRATVVVCAVIISGATFVVTWSAGDPHVGQVRGSVVVAIIYLITDVIVVVMAGLLLSVWGIARAYRLQLRLLAAALAFIAISDGLYAYLVTIGKEQLPPSDAGYVIGPFLIALAAAVAPESLSNQSSVECGTGVSSPVRPRRRPRGIRR